MNKQDKQAFADGYALTCLAYEKKFNPEQAQLYFSDLSEYEISQVISAMTQHRKDPERGRFFPSIADLIYQINMKTTQALSAEKMAILWSVAIKAASNGKLPATNDQYLLAALQMIGGHKAVGYADPIELNRLQKEFSANYAAIAKAKAHELPAHLHNLQALTAMKTGLIKP